jgi:hypothetical protein
LKSILKKTISEIALDGGNWSVVVVSYWNNFIVFCSILKAIIRCVILNGAKTCLNGRIYALSIEVVRFNILFSLLNLIDNWIKLWNNRSLLNKKIICTLRYTKVIVGQIIISTWKIIDSISIIFKCIQIDEILPFHIKISNSI